jgi:hypothetical protein
MFEEIEGTTDQLLTGQDEEDILLQWVPTLSLAPPLRYNNTATNVQQWGSCLLGSTINEH